MIFENDHCYLRKHICLIYILLDLIFYLEEIMRINMHHTKGDGNCFFHATFGNKNSSQVFEADQAANMRNAWHDFLKPFRSLANEEMPKALYHQLRKIFEFFLVYPHDLTGKAKEVKVLMEINKKEQLVADEAAKKLKQAIIKKFNEDEPFRKEMYETIGKLFEIKRENLPNETVLLANQSKLESIVHANLRIYAEIYDKRITEIVFDAIYKSDKIAESVLHSEKLYQLYLSAISDPMYYIFFMEIPILASLAGITIEVYQDGGNAEVPIIYKPTSEMLPKDYIKKDLWGDKKQEKIYHAGVHYSRAEISKDQAKSSDSDRDKKYSDGISGMYSSKFWNKQSMPKDSPDPDKSRIIEIKDMPSFDKLKKLIDEKTMALRLEKADKEKLLAENELEYMAKIEDADSKAKEQKQAFQDQQKLLQEEETLKKVISELEITLKENHGDQIVEDKAADMDLSLDDFSYNKIQSKIRKKRHDIASYKKLAGGKSLLEENLKDIEQKIKEVQRTIEIIEKDQTTLQTKKNQQQAIITSSQQKLDAYHGELSQLEDTKKNKINAKGGREDEKKQILSQQNEDKMRWSDYLDSPKVTVTVTPGLERGTKLSANLIRTNGLTLAPYPQEDWGGLQVAFIDLASNKIIFQQFFKIHNPHQYEDINRKKWYCPDEEEERYAIDAIKAYHSKENILTVIHCVNLNVAPMFGIGIMPSELFDYLVSIGGEGFGHFFYSGMWYYIKASSGEAEKSSGDKTKIYTFHVSREIIRSSYQKALNEMADKIKHIEDQIETMDKEIITFDSSIKKIRDSIESEESKKSDAEEEIVSINNSINNNIEMLKPFQERLTRFLKEQQTVKDRIKGVILPEPPLAQDNPSMDQKESADQGQKLQTILREKQAELKKVQEGLLAAKTKIRRLVCPQGYMGDIPLLTTAVFASNLSLLHSLLEWGAKPNETDEHGWTPLHCAVAKASIGNLTIAKQMIQLLLQYDGRLDIGNDEGLLPHQIAITPEIQQMILDIGLNTYARKGNFNHCQLLLAHKANPNNKEGIAKDPANHDRENEWIDEGRTSLTWAIVSFSKNSDLVTLLLQHKADPKIENKNGRNAFMQAERVKDKSPKVASILFEELKKTSQSSTTNPIPNSAA